MYVRGDCQLIVCIILKRTMDTAYGVNYEGVIVVWWNELIRAITTVHCEFVVYMALRSSVNYAGVIALYDGTNGNVS